MNREVSTIDNFDLTPELLCAHPLPCCSSWPFQKMNAPIKVTIYDVSTVYECRHIASAQLLQSGLLIGIKPNSNWYSWCIFCLLGKIYQARHTLISLQLLPTTVTVQSTLQFLWLLSPDYCMLLSYSQNSLSVSRLSNDVQYCNVCPVILLNCYPWMFSLCFRSVAKAWPVCHSIPMA